MTDNTTLLAHFPNGHQVHDDGQSDLPAERHNLTMRVERIGSKVVFATDCPVVALYCDHEVEREFTAESEWADNQPQTFTVNAESFELLLIFEDDVIANIYKVEGNTLNSQMITGMQTWDVVPLEAPRLFELPEYVEGSLAAGFESPCPISALSAQLTIAAMQEDPYQADHLREWWESLSEDVQRQWLNSALNRIESMRERWEQTLKDSVDSALEEFQPTLTQNRVRSLATHRAELHNFVRITQDLDVKRDLHDLDTEIDVCWFQLRMEPLLDSYCEVITGAAIDWYLDNRESHDLNPWWDISRWG